MKCNCISCSLYFHCCQLPDAAWNAFQLILFELVLNIVWFLLFHDFILFLNEYAMMWYSKCLQIYFSSPTCNSILLAVLTTRMQKRDICGIHDKVLTLAKLFTLENSTATTIVSCMLKGSQSKVDLLIFTTFLLKDFLNSLLCHYNYFLT